VERDVGGVAVDGGKARRTVADRACDAAGVARAAHERRLVRVEIAQVDVGDGVGVRQVERPQAGEGDAPAVVADRRFEAGLVGRRAVGAAARERDGAGQAVLHEDVGDGVVVLAAQPVRA
jgi:hypothetical protein